MWGYGAAKDVTIKVGATASQAQRSPAASSDCGRAGAITFLFPWSVGLRLEALQNGSLDKGVKVLQARCVGRLCV